MDRQVVTRVQPRRPVAAWRRRVGVLRALRRSEACARLGLYVHVLAFVLLPGLHNVHHAEAHGQAHASDTSAHASAHQNGKAHAHPMGGTEQVIPRAEIPPAPAAPLAPAQVPTHEHGGLEHFSAALLAAVSFHFVPAIALGGRLEPAPLEDAVPNAAPFGPRLPRGPPV